MQQRLESGVQEARLAQIEKATLALAWKRCGIFERGDIFLPGLPRLVGLARALLIWTLYQLLSKRKMGPGEGT